MKKKIKTSASKMVRRKRSLEDADTSLVVLSLRMYVLYRSSFVVLLVSGGDAIEDD